MTDSLHEPTGFGRLESLFDRALDLPEEERERFVERESEGDGALAGEVLALLEEHESDSVLPDLPPLTSAEPARGSPGPEEAVPAQIGHYQILEKIAEGGMGSVYLAEQREPMRRRVALKLLKPGMSSADVMARFEAERQALAMMDHPNIARVFEGGVSDDGRPYFAMEYVSGEPLTTFCDRQRLSLQERLEIYVKVCAAVQHAHQKGVIHRDLKPSNVLVTAGEGAAEPKVIDFGIAKAVGARLTQETLFTAHGLLVGTPEYMSPEQAQGGTLDIDTRSDVYSLGVLLYEVLVGHLPFDRETLSEAGISEALRVLREEEPPRPSTRLGSLGAEERQSVVRERKSSELEIRRELGRDLDWIVLRALEKDRNRRYASASELAADVERYLRNEPVLAGPPSASYRMRKFVRRHRLEVAGAALLAVVLAGSAVTVSLQARRLRQALDESRQQTVRAETVSSLLVDAFEEADPTRRVVDREVTAREVLERGAASLEDRSLSNEVRAALSSSMASAFLGLGDIERAEALAESSLEAAESVGGEPLANALILESRVLRAQSRYEEAAELSRRAMEHADQKDLAARIRIGARQALGTDLQKAARYAAADAVLLEAEELASSSSGIDEMLVANLLLARAENAQFRAEYEAAFELGKRALENMTAASDNPIHSVQARMGIAVSLAELGRLQEAIEWDRESFDIARERLGREHPTTRTLRNNYAIRLHFNAKSREALDLFEESVAISRRVDPVGELLTRELNNLGLVQQGLGRLDEAEATFREVLELQYRIVGRDNPYPGYHEMNLARVLQDFGRYEEAEVHYQRALALWQRLLPEDHTLVGNVNIWFGALLVETGRAERALEMIQKGVAIREADRGSVDWQTAEARSWLGTALAELGELGRAESLLVEAYPPILEQRGPEWTRTRWALRRILGYYDLVGDGAGFARWAAEYEKHYGALDPIEASRRWSSH